jgi:hypothetical protein
MKIFFSKILVLSVLVAAFSFVSCEDVNSSSSPSAPSFTPKTITSYDDMMGVTWSGTMTVSGTDYTVVYEFKEGSYEASGMGSPMEYIYTTGVTETVAGETLVFTFSAYYNNGTNTDADASEKTFTILADGITMTYTAMGSLIEFSQVDN